MKKNNSIDINRGILLFLLLLIITIDGLAQKNKSHNIILADIENSEPISFAYIFNNTNNFQTISNVNGEADIYYNLEEDSIGISHITYKLLKTTISVLLENDTVYMHKNEHILSTVYITDISPEQILLKALENTSQKLFVPGKVEAYYNPWFVSSRNNGNPLIILPDYSRTEQL